MNYAQLSQAIQDYVQSTETSFVNNIPTFVRQAEERIYNTIQFPALRRNMIGTTAASNKYLACPNDFLASYSLAVILPNGSYEYLLNKDVNFIREAYPSPTDTGVPAYYALFGPRSDQPTELTFILGPTPDNVYSVSYTHLTLPTKRIV